MIGTLHSVYVVGYCCLKSVEWSCNWEQDFQEEFQDSRISHSLSLSLSQASFEQLSLVEFRELLRLVNTCPLEKLDPCLTALRRQTKKWFRRLMALVQLQLHS